MCVQNMTIKNDWIDIHKKKADAETFSKTESFLLFPLYK